MSPRDAAETKAAGVKEPDSPSIPVSKQAIPLCAPEMRGNEWQYIKECLDTTWVSSAGPFVGRFEKMVAGYLGAKYGVATSSGTAALHVALLVAGIQPDDEVLVSALTFIAPVNAIRYVGAWPVFIDAEPGTWQMDPQKVINFLNTECQWRRGSLYNKTTGRAVKAVLPVHILGHPVDMDPILEAARERGLAVVEDATESFGAHYKGCMVGHIGDVGCFSFNANKMITTGGGGMIVTDNEEWALRAKYLTTQAKDDPVEYIHGEIGFNYRLTGILAAMGCAQMEQLDDFIEAKRRIAASYSEPLGTIPGITPMSEAPWADSVFWMYTVLIDDLLYGVSSRVLLSRLAKSGIETRPLWQPINESPAYVNGSPAHCPVARGLYQQGLSLPCSVGLGQLELQRVVDSIRAAGQTREAAR